MTFKGRSLDDLPLAAYARGIHADEPLEAEEAADAAPAPAPAFAPPALGEDAGSLDLSTEATATASPRLSIPALPAVPPWLANPRAHLRDPRLLMTGVIGVGIVLLAASLVLGGGPAAGSDGSGAGASTAPVVFATVAPPSGDATVEVTGKLAGAYQLAGATGTGPATGGRIAATWADITGASLTLSGAASAGTRTTDPTFVLTWSVLVEDAAVTFTSDAGECTVGMAVQPRTVTGSFVCKKLKSDDGKLTVDVRGTYRT